MISITIKSHNDKIRNNMNPGIRFLFSASSMSHMEPGTSSSGNRGDLDRRGGMKERDSLWGRVRGVASREEGPHSIITSITSILKSWPAHTHV